MSNQNFLSQLERQMDFLGRSCALYDELDYQDEAIRMAVAIRTLFHQTRSSTSLVTHLNIKNIKLFSSIPIDYPPISENPTFFQGLSMAKITHGKGAVLLPTLDNGPPIGGLLDFDVWWNQTVWIHQDMTLSRKQLVLFAANKDGGAHVDEKLPESYEKYIGSDGFMEIASSTIGGNETFVYNFKNTHYSSLRQISYEVLKCEELINLMPNAKMV